MRKALNLLAIIALAALIGFAITACGEPGGGVEPEDPENIDETIQVMFDVLYGVKVQGYMTRTELGNIKSALEAEYLSFSALFKAVFSRVGTIVVESAPAYANYKTTVGGNKIYINSNVLKKASDLRAALKNAARANNGDPTADLEA
ncbi:MAG: hypothetical protein FWD28_09090 [Treponema sp.]|nr:hypothetical protein [Treponema sp.]